MWLEFFPSWNSSPAELLVLQGERFKGCLKICFLLKLIQTDKPGWGKFQCWIFSLERRDEISFPALGRTALAPRVTTSCHCHLPGLVGKALGVSQPKAITP